MGLVSLEYDMNVTNLRHLGPVHEQPRHKRLEKNIIILTLHKYPVFVFSINLWPEIPTVFSNQCEEKQLRNFISATQASTFWRKWFNHSA